MYASDLHYYWYVIEMSMDVSNEGVQSASGPNLISLGGARPDSPARLHCNHSGLKQYGQGRHLRSISDR